MTDECRIVCCRECKKPLTAIDCYGGAADRFHVVQYLVVIGRH